MKYKIFNNITPSCLPIYFKLTSEIHQQSLRSTTENQLYIPKHNTELYRNSQAYSGFKIRNAIPGHMKECTSFENFKKGNLRGGIYVVLHVVLYCLLCMQILFMF